MPTPPEKSELLRLKERTEIYPFSTLPVEEMERGQILKAF